jgi:hypothetical protein
MPESVGKLGCPQIYRVDLTSNYVEKQSVMSPVRLSAGVGQAKRASFIADSSDRVLLEANFHKV